eukprot:3255041-Pleurochrysis_carterae.AAC.1
MTGTQAIERALTPSRVNRALRARKKWAHQSIHVQRLPYLHATSALDAVMDICDCKERRIKRR